VLKPKVLSLGLIALLFQVLVYAEDLSLSDRLYDLEAQIESLKSEIATTKNQALQERANAFNPSISVIGDFVGQYNFGESKNFSSGLIVREIELELRAEIDPYADGLISIGMGEHSHDGHSHLAFHLEEAYARFKSIPGLGYAPLGMILKAGRFKPSIGRLNRVHLHNAPQVYYPKALQVFLGDEGFSSQGLAVNFSVNPSQKSAVNFFVEGLFSSRLPLQEDQAEKMPSGVVHLWWHQELFLDHYLDIGTSHFFGRKAGENSGLFYLLGADVHYSFIPKGFGQDPVFLCGSELFTANKTTNGRWPLGVYTWAQARLFDGTFFGLLYDLAPKEKYLSEFQHSLGAFLTYYTSEFLRLRLGYEHVMPNINSFKGEERLMLSMIFILGSHPIEPYFINR
jgi:hypothetical protein